MSLKQVLLTGIIVTTAFEAMADQSPHPKPKPSQHLSGSGSGSGSETKPALQSDKIIDLLDHSPYVALTLGEIEQVMGERKKALSKLIEQPSLRTSSVRRETSEYKQLLDSLVQKGEVKAIPVDKGQVYYLTSKTLQDIKSAIATLRILEVKKLSHLLSSECSNDLNSWIEAAQKCFSSKNPNCKTAIPETYKQKVPKSNPCTYTFETIFPELRGLSDEASNVTKAIANSDKRVILLEGVPGAGKSSTVLKFIVYPLQNVEKKKVFLTAPNVGGIAALNQDFKGFKVLPFEEIFAEDTTGNLKDSIIVVDEVYLSTLDQFNQLLKAALYNNATLILSGDSAQNLPNALPIIGLLENEIADKLIEHQKLTKTFRTSDKEMQEFVSTAVQKGISGAFAELVVKKKQQFHEIKHDPNQPVNVELIADSIIGQIPQSPEAKDFAIILPPPLLIEPSSATQVQKPLTSSLSSQSQGELQDLVNKKFHEAFIDPGNKNTSFVSVLDKRYSPKVLGYVGQSTGKKIPLSVGSKIIFTEKDNDFNKGDMVTVTAINGPSLKVSRNREEKVLTLEKKNNKFDLAYALTSQDSQGAAWPKVVILVTPETNLAELYVALTRSKTETVIMLYGLTIQNILDSLKTSALNFPDRNEEAKKRMISLLKSVEWLVKRVPEAKLTEEGSKVHQAATGLGKAVEKMVEAAPKSSTK